MTLKLLPTALVLALSTALIGCGGDKSAQKPADADDKAKASEGDKAGATGELAESQVLTISNASEPESIDPHKASGTPESAIMRQMLVGLTTTDTDGKTVAGMASEWNSTDNKVWTFKLRDAKWSNGDPVTANDFVYSFRRLVDPATASPYSTYLADFKVVNAQDIVDGKVKPDQLGVKTIDDKTLEITLAEPVPYFPDTLIHSAVLPVHQKSIETHAEKWTSPGNYVVNGPYQLKDWKVNERIVLERNKNYFDDAKTTINELVILPINSATTEVDRYKAGEVDITNTVPPEQFDKLKTELGEQVRVSPQLCTYYYEFNHTKKPFDDVRVRKALALTLDRETITDKIVKRGEKPAYQFSPEAIAGINTYTPEWKAWDKAKRIEEAKKLLNEAGFNESNPLKFELLYNTDENHKKLAVAAASFWKEALGFVEVTLTNQEWKTYLDTRRNQKHQISRGGWCADYNEASTFLNTFKSNSSSNYGKYANPEFDKLMASTLGGSVTPEQRADLYKQAEEMLDKDSATIFVYQYVSPRLVKPYVAGYSNKDPQDHWQAKDMKILKH